MERHTYTHIKQYKLQEILIDYIEPQQSGSKKRLAMEEDEKLNRRMDVFKQALTFHKSLLNVSQLEPTKLPPFL